MTPRYAACVTAAHVAMEVVGACWFALLVTMLSAGDLQYKRYGVVRHPIYSRMFGLMIASLWKLGKSVRLYEPFQGRPSAGSMAPGDITRRPSFSTATASSRVPMGSTPSWVAVDIDSDQRASA